MLLLNIDISSIPLNALSALVAFASSYAVVRQKIKSLKEAVKLLKTANTASHMEMDNLNNLRQEDKDTYFKIREKDLKAIEQKFQDADYRRELLKDVLTSKIHDIDKKLSEIHAVVVHKK